MSDLTIALVGGSVGHVLGPVVGESVTSRTAVAHRLGRHWLVLAVGFGAGLPVLVSTIRALGAGWMPMGDQGIIATRAYDVLTSHTPLLGQYSEASIITGRATYSPGPMLYWLLALPARVGAPASLTLTTAAVNIVSILGVVALARRRGGQVLAIGSGAALALLCISFSTESLHGIFNPSAALFPFVLLIFMCWSLACGDHWLLPPIVLVASFVTQAHLAYLPPSLGLVVVGLIGLAASRRSLGLSARSLRRWALAALVVGLLCWSAPIVDQLGHHRGNISALAAEATSKAKNQGLDRAWRATLQAVGVVPRWLRPPGANARPASGADYGDSRLPDLFASAGVVRKASTVVLLAALVLVAGVGARRGRRDLVAGAVIGLVLCVALAAVVAETPIAATNTLGYSLWWGSVAGMWGWLFLAWSAAVLLRPSAPLRAPAVASLVGAAAAVAAGGAVAAAKGPDTHETFYRPTRDLAAGLDRALPRGRTVRLVASGPGTRVIEPTIRYTLRQHGVRALGYYAALRPGSWYELDHHRVAYIVSVNAHRLPRRRLARVVARTTLATAAVSPGH